MPGRGQGWKEGGHVDDTILSEDIKDGTIAEEDLDSAVQAKLNSGGGGGFDKTEIGTFGDWFVYDEMVHPTKAGVQVHWETFFNSNETFNVPTARAGVVEFGTGTGVNQNGTSIRTCAGGGAGIALGSDYLYRTRLFLQSNVGVMLWMGGMDPQFPDGNNKTTIATAEGGGGIVDNGIFFRYDSATDTNYQCITRSSGTDTIVDSGVATDNSFHEFEITSDGTNAIFKIDGNQVADITTNIPTGTNLITGNQINSKATNPSDNRKYSTDMMFIYSTTRT